jgi:hypothetical protein
MSDFIPAPEDDPQSPHVGPTTMERFLCGVGRPDMESEILENLRITRHEAEILMVYWFERFREIYELCVICQYSGSSEWRQKMYSSARFDLLWDYTGQECRDWLSTEVVRRDVELDEDLKRQADEDLKSEVSDDSYGSFTDSASPDSERDSDLG